MAFTTENLVINEGLIEVVVRSDTALDMTEEEYDDYLETLDKSLIKVKPGEEVTTFVLRLRLPYKHATRVENEKYGLSKDGPVVKGAYVIEEIRAALREVKYDEDSKVPMDKRLVLKFDGDGLVDSKQIAQLFQAGVVQNLSSARNQALKREGDAKKLQKKS